MPKSKSIENEELRDLLNQNYPCLLVDVREDSEYQSGHIPQAIGVPLEQLADYAAFWPNDSRVVIICNTVNRSAAACRLLERQGYTNVEFAVPGMANWCGPLVKGLITDDGWGYHQSVRIYLDNAATTRLYPEVASAMWWCLSQALGNPSSVHYYGRCMKEMVIQARRQVADLINANPQDIVFTSGGTEADNLALWGILRALPKSKRRLITSAIEHKAILANLPILEKAGFVVTVLPVDHYGRVAPRRLRQALGEDVGLVSIMAANNEVGTIQPIQELAKLSHSYGAFFHSDGVQAAGYLQLDVERLGIDALSLSAHKLGGPKGIGALYVRDEIPLCPQINGGGQEGNRRSGTENVPGIVGFGLACKKTREQLANVADISRLRDYLEGEIRSLSHVTIYGHPKERLANNLCFSLRNREGHDLVLDLDLQGIACSSGSACSGSKYASHVLQAMGYSVKQSRQAIRFSLGWNNTRAEMEKVATVLDCLAKEDAN